MRERDLKEVFVFFCSGEVFFFAPPLGLDRGVNPSAEVFLQLFDVHFDIVRLFGFFPILFIHLEHVVRHEVPVLNINPAGHEDVFIVGDLGEVLVRELLYVRVFFFGFSFPRFVPPHLGDVQLPAGAGFGDFFYEVGVFGVLVYDPCVDPIQNKPDGCFGAFDFGVGRPGQVY